MLHNDPSKRNAVPPRPATTTHCTGACQDHARYRRTVPDATGRCHRTVPGITGWCQVPQGTVPGATGLTRKAGITPPPPPPYPPYSPQVLAPFRTGSGPLLKKCLFSPDWFRTTLSGLVQDYPDYPDWYRTRGGPSHHAPKKSSSRLRSGLAFSALRTSGSLETKFPDY